MKIHADLVQKATIDTNLKEKNVACHLIVLREIVLFEKYPKDYNELGKKQQIPNLTIKLEIVFF